MYKYIDLTVEAYGEGVLLNSIIDITVVQQREG